jgi:hypothetical protein
MIKLLIKSKHKNRDLKKHYTSGYRKRPLKDYERYNTGKRYNLDGDGLTTCRVCSFFHDCRLNVGVSVKVEEYPYRWIRQMLCEIYGFFMCFKRQVSLWTNVGAHQPKSMVQKADLAKREKMQFSHYYTSKSDGIILFKYLQKINTYIDYNTTDALFPKGQQIILDFPPRCPHFTKIT